jgi:hypothetical protein
LKKEKYIDFSWKFVPDKENRKTPDCRKYNCDDPFQLLRWRNDVRLFFLNWRNVWFTYKYLLNYFPFLGLLIWLLSGSLISVLATITIFIPLRIVIYKKISTLDKLEILMPLFIDSQLTPVFGSLLPFTKSVQ